jgi:putative phosphoribosyl transferase
MESRFGMHDITLKDKTLIVVDDGIATGATLVCAIRILRKQEPAAIIVATPVASRSAAVSIGQNADGFVSVQTIDEFRGVGKYYHDFHQLDDQEMADYLQRVGARPRPVTIRDSGI